MSLRACAQCAHAAHEHAAVNEITGREGYYAVSCAGCGMTTGAHATAAAARMVWNRRAEASAAERVQKILARYGGDICGALLALERCEAMLKSLGEAT